MAKKSLFVFVLAVIAVMGAYADPPEFTFSNIGAGGYSTGDIPDMADDKFTFNWNIGNINNELKISQEKYSYIFSAQLINYYIDYDTKILFELSPLKYWLFCEDGTQKMTFFNVGISYNIIDPKHYMHLLGPIVSINWLENENFANFKIENYIFSIGIRYAYRIKLEGGTFKHPAYTFYLFDFESGYRNINGEHSIYIGVRIEPSILFVGYLMLGMLISGQLM